MEVMLADPSCGHHPIPTAELIARFDELYGDRRARDRHGLFVIEGLRNFRLAVDGGWEIVAVLVSRTLLKSSACLQQVRALEQNGVPVARASPEEFRAVSRAEHASGIAAVVRQRVLPLHELPRRGVCWLVVSRLRAHGNLGTLLRTSAAVGGEGLIVLGGHVDPFDPAVVRASMGALFRQQVVRTGAKQLSHWARRHRLQVVGASPEGSCAPYYEVQYRAPTLIVLGEERRGLEDLTGLCHQLVRIPMGPDTDSLNVAIAGSLILYEVVRPRRYREAASPKRTR